MHSAFLHLSFQHFSFRRFGLRLGVFLATSLRFLAVFLPVGFSAAPLPARSGAIIAWGENDQGQTAVLIALSHVTAIAAGGNHTLALRRDGTVVA